MNNISKVASIVLFAAMSHPAHAYQAQVATTSAPVAADDVVVMEFIKTPLTIGSNILPSTNFNLIVSGSSVSMERTVPKATAPGFKSTSMLLSSLDIMHDKNIASTPSEEATKLYDVRVYFNKEFTWVEIRRSNVPAAPTLNTAFFVGAPDDVYTAYRSGTYSGAKFANYAALKDDVQGNYAGPYDPRNPGLIQYAALQKAAVIYTANTVSTTD
jgi:hypothetical protein